MRDVFVHLEFHRLRVHQNHAEFVRSLAKEHRSHEGVNADRLTGTRLTGNQQVRGLRQIHRERFTGNVLTERHNNLVGRRFELFALENIKTVHRLEFAVRNFNTHGRLARNRGQNADRRDLERKRQVFLQGGESAHLHARTRFHFKAGNHRARFATNHAALHLEVFKLFFEHFANSIQFFFAVIGRLRFMFFQNVANGRHLVFVVNRRRVTLRNRGRLHARSRSSARHCTH